MLRDAVINAHRQLTQLIGAPGIEIRTHGAYGSNTIYRLDDQILIIPTLWGVSPADTPKFIATRGAPHGMFDPCLKHFDTLWQHSRPFTAPTGPAAGDPADDALQQDPAYQLALYEAKAALQDNLHAAQREYEHTLEDLQARHRARHRNWPTWTKR